VPKRNSTTNVTLTLLGLVAALLAWRIVVTNMAEFFIRGDEQDAAARALSWDGTNAQALFSEGLRSARTNPARAINYLSAAVRNNPTDGPSYAALARLKEESGNLAEAGLAMQAAAQMAPRRVDVQMEAAGFWFRRGDIARAMKHMDVVLTFGDSLHGDLFPDLLKLAEDPATRETLQPTGCIHNVHGRSSSRSKSVFIPLSMPRTAGMGRTGMNSMRSPY